LSGEVRRFKERIRREVWSLLERRGVARFPRPVYGRIPNFEGSEKAAERLASLEVFRSAEVVKVNPDSPQQKVRELALNMGKIVLMPTPRLRKGFLLLDPSSVPLSKRRAASTIRGAFTYGRLVGLDEIPEVDLVVTGSVAIDRRGVRIGKGGGYAELEYGILRELGKVRESTPVVTTIHDLQLLGTEFPSMPYDLVVDLAVTPTRTISFEGVWKPRPRGIYWELLPQQKLEEIPLLRELTKRVKKAKHNNPW